MTSSDAKIAVITGASSGVGRATAIALASQGWSIIGFGRDPTRCTQAEGAISAAAKPGARVHFIRGDLALMSDVARIADAILRLTDTIHVLINNAGGVRDRMSITPEGNEATFASNHLGHFFLTNLLLGTMQRTAGQSAPGSVRILSVSSSGHECCPGIDWNDLQQAGNWASGKNYCLAKLCNLLFTHELARRIASDGLVAHAIHPGEVASNFTSHATAEMRALTANTVRVPPETPARTLFWLATDNKVGNSTGRYFFNQAEAQPSDAALDDEAAARLWVESQRLIEKAGFSISNNTAKRPASA